jgi:hypothetical protein
LRAREGEDNAARFLFFTKIDLPREVGVTFVRESSCPKFTPISRGIAAQSHRSPPPSRATAFTHVRRNGSLV